MNALRRVVELGWRGINRARRAFYRRGWISARRLPRPVVSVGSVAAGGAGKTPTTIAVARLLVENGIRVAILTRGYGKTNESTAEVVDADDPVRFGDEPVLFRKTLPGVDVIVGADRWSSANRYLQEHDCDLFLLDDGFQHLQLARDVDLVIDHAGDSWMRESRAALRWADAVLVRDRKGESVFGRPAFQIRLDPVGFELDGQNHPLDWIRGRAVVAFSGLADNAQFFRSLASLGADVGGTRGFPDHHRYSSRDLTDLADLARGVSDAVLVTTEKDGVKLPAMGAAILRVEMAIEPREQFREFLVAAVRGGAAT